MQGAKPNDYENRGRSNSTYKMVGKFKKAQYLIVSKIQQHEENT